MGHILLVTDKQSFAASWKKRMLKHKVYKEGFQIMFKRVYKEGFKKSVFKEGFVFITNFIEFRHAIPMPVILEVFLIKYFF